jgi:hypothetical protein
MTAVVLTLVSPFPLTSLAKITSAIMLLVFGTANLDLWCIKGKGNDPNPHGDGPRFPRWLLLVGFIATIAVLLF